MGQAGSTPQLMGQSDKPSNTKQERVKGEGQAGVQGGQTRTWPLRGTDERVAVTFISHLEAGSGFTGGLVRPWE